MCKIVASKFFGKKLKRIMKFFFGIEPFTLKNGKFFFYYYLVRNYFYAEFLIP